MKQFHKQRINQARASWREKIFAQQASGQAVSEYCDKLGICPSSFYTWRKRLGMNGSAPVPAIQQMMRLTAGRKVAAPGFQQIVPDVVRSAERSVDVLHRSRHPVLWIETPGGYRLSVGGGSDLAQVLEVLNR